jgi:hypothetical protein
VLRPDYRDSTLPAFGLVEESAKLNINAATLDQLLRLPLMTEDIAAAIIDWRDQDDNVTPFGAESDYYQSLQTPYTAKNAPFETVEELLLVRDFSRELLYGDGQPAPLGEVQTMRSSAGQALFSDLVSIRGMYDLLTVYSAEPGTAADGQQRINLSDASQRTRLVQLLQRELGTMRGNQVVQAIGTAPLRDVFDLHFRARLTAEELDRIADYLTSSPDGRPVQAGQAPQAARQTSSRINIFTAPREVLACLGPLEPADVDTLLAQRRTISSSNPTAIAWVAEALGERAIGLGGRITGRSLQYSADILAASGNGRAFKRWRIVIDTSGGSPQIIYRRDLTQRGWPMDEQVLASLRAGEGPAGWGSISGGLLR